MRLGHYLCLCQIISANVERTGGLIFTIHYVESGTVVNNGRSPSNPVVILVTVKDDVGNTIFTITSPDPRILQPQRVFTNS